MTLTENNVFVSDRKRELDLCEEKSVGHIVINQLGKGDQDKVLMIDYASGRKWKASELKEKALNLASGLIKLHNFQPGSVTVISYPCSDWQTIVALGVICAGGAVVSLMADVPYDEILVVAKRVEFKLLFCTLPNKQWADKLEVDMGYPITTILMESSYSDERSLNYLLNYDRTKLCDQEVPRPCYDKKKDWALIEMTSGTTGYPKAAVLTHYNLMNEFITVCPIEKGDRILSKSMIVDYIVPRKMTLCGLYKGMRLIMLKNQDVEIILEVIEKYQVDMLFMSAFLLYNLMTFDRLKEYNIESVEIVCGFGSKLTYISKLRDFLNEHNHIRYFSIGYGTSEVGTISRDDIESKEFLTVDHGTGRLECGTKVRIVDQETGENLGTNKPGQIHVLNPTSFPGYIDKEWQRATLATEPLVRNSQIFDDQGYYITGDIGHFNDKHELFVHGRIKEVMLLTYWKVTPHDIEEVIGQHPAVHSICVLALKSEDNPTLDWPRAFVKLKSEYYTDESITNFKSGDGSTNESQNLEHKGTHKLCSIPQERRRRITEDILEYYESKVYPEKRLKAGLVILDELKVLVNSGKVNKEYLRSLTLEEIEVYGDRRGL